MLLLPARADSKIGTYPNAKRRPSCAANATVRASILLLVGRSFRLGAGLALAVTPLEASDPTTAVQNLLLTRVERVALRADLDDDMAIFLSAAGLEGVAATADHGGLAVGGMNVSFHGVLFTSRSPGRQIVLKIGREPEPERRLLIMPAQPL